MYNIIKNLKILANNNLFLFVVVFLFLMLWMFNEVVHVKNMFENICKMWAEQKKIGDKMLFWVVVSIAIFIPYFVFLWLFIA